MNNDIGQILRQCRVNCALSQQQVADALNIDRSTYAYYETGHTLPSITTLSKLAEIFNVPLASLFPKAKTAELHDSGAIPFSPIYQLPKAERSLLIKFRVLSEKDKKEIIDEINKRLG